MCMDNSATSEELAAGMEETAATTETIYSSIATMQKRVRLILMNYPCLEIRFQRKCLKEQIS